MITSYVIQAAQSVGISTRGGGGDTRSIQMWFASTKRQFLQLPAATLCLLCPLWPIECYLGMLNKRSRPGAINMVKRLPTQAPTPLLPWEF